MPLYSGVTLLIERLVQENMRFLQLRAISNVAQPGEDDWDMAGSVQALTDGLHRLLAQLGA